MNDDDERLRIDDEDDRQAFDRAEAGGWPVGAIVLAVTKTVASYPAAAGKFFAFSVKTLLGTETEGSPGTTTTASDTLYAYLPVGATVPTTGSEFVAARVPDRWVMLR